MGKRKDSSSDKAYKYDPDFDGIDTNRHCTDCCFLIFFILFICGMLALLFVSIPKSNYKYVYLPHDHRGLLCGYNNKNLNVPNSSDLPDLSGKDKLFWVRPGVSGYSRSFCVESCPDVGFYTDTFNDENYNRMDEGHPSDYVCGNYNGQQYFATIENYSSTSENRFFCPYATTELILRCFPNTDALSNVIDVDIQDVQEVVNAFGESMSVASTAIRAVQDVYNTYPYIAACVAAALALSIFWLLLLRCLTGVFVWLTVLLAAAALGGLTYMCYRQWKDEFNNHATIERYTFGFISEEMNQKVFQVFFWILIAIDAIFILLIIFLFSRIRLSIKVIKLVSRAFGKAPSLFVFPVIQYLIMFVWWIYVIGVAIVLFGAGTPTRSFVEEGNSVVDKITMKYDPIIQGFAIYHFIGFLWVTLFISALGEMTVAGVICQFYFTRDKKKLKGCLVTRSFFRALRYHVGSLALGSFIITICKLIRYIMEYVDQKTKNTQSTIATFLIKCCKCCLWCLEKFLKFLNRNAYIMIAMHGYNFWGGAKRAFSLILRNCVRVATLNWVGDFTLFLGRLFVSAGVTAFSLWFFKTNDDVQFYIVPSAIVFVMSFLASSAFTGVFEIGIDSMFLCFMEDEERNEGHELFASRKLKKFMSKNKKLEEADGKGPEAL